MLRPRNNDARLVRRTLSGQLDAFSILVERYERLIFASAYGIVSNASDAEDVTQDAFLTAFQKLPSLREPAKFRSWILTIARNQSADLITRRRRETPIVETDLPNVDESEAIADAELRVLLRDRIERLPVEHREILLLHYYAGLKVREIAGQLDISNEAAKKRLQRARDVLSQRMLVNLRDTIEEQSSSSTRTKTIIGFVAGASATWETTATAAAATGLLTSSVVLKFGISAAIAAGVVGAAIWSDTKSEPSPQETAIAVAPAEVASGPFAASTTAPNGQAASAPETRPTATPNERPVDTGGVIHGRVVNPSGSPQADVLVTADSGNKQYSDHYESTTDGNGRFRFTGMRTGGSYLLQGLADKAFAAGESVANNTKDGKEDDQELMLLPAANLSGVVTDSTGLPLPDVLVNPYKAPIDGKPEHVSDAWKRLRGVRTDNEGQFTLHHAWLGDWTLEIDSPEHVYLQAENLNPTKSPNIIKLEEGAKVSGRVVYAGTDRGVPGLDLRMGHPRKTTTNQNGDFSMAGVKFGVFDINEGTGLVVTSPRIPILPGREISGVRVEVARSGSISGRVTSAKTGEPIGVAFVEFAGVSFSTTKVVQTDERGYYELRGLQPGLYRPSIVQQWNYVSLNPADAEPVEIEYGARITGMDFQLSPGRSISGTVNIPEEEIREEIRVTGEYTLASGDNIIIGSNLQSNGTFGLSGLPMSAKVTVQLEGAGWTSETIGPLSLSTGNIEGVHLTAIQIAGATVSGRVTFGNNLPRAGETVFLSSVDEESGALSAQSDEGGRFEFTYVPPGRYTAMVFGVRGGKRVEVNVRSGRDVNDVVVHVGGGSATISGRVLDWKGNPIENASIHASDVPTVETDADGYYTLQGIEDRTYNVSVHAQGFGMGQRDDVAPNSHGIDFRLEPRGHVEGTIVDARSGTPIGEFEVNSYHSVTQNTIEYALRELQLQHQISTDGVFRVLDIPAGERFIVAAADGYYPGFTKVLVKPEEILSGTVVRLEPAPVAHAEVVDANGAAVANAKIFAHKLPHTFDNNSFNKEIPITDRNGIAKLNRLLPGVNNVFVYHPEHGSAAFVVDSTRERDTVTLRLPAATSLTVHVTNNNTPVENARLTLSRAAYANDPYFANQSGETNEEGSYIFEHAQPGQANLNVIGTIGGFNRQIEIREGESATLEIEIGGGTSTIAAQVLLPDYLASSETMAALIVETADGLIESTARTDGQGALKFHDIRAGAATLLVRVQRDATGTQIGRSMSFPISPGQTISRTVDFAMGTTVHGTATGLPPNGEYWAVLLSGQVDPSVLSSGEFGRNQTLITHQMRLDASGVYRLDSVEPGVHTLVVTKDGMREFVSQVIEVGSRVMQVDLALN